MRHTRVSGHRVTQSRNRLPFVKPGRQNLGDEIVMRRKFAAKQAFAVEPKRVEALEESGFVRRHRGAREEECKKTGRHFALKQAEVRRQHCLPGKGLRRLGHLRRVRVLAFQHSLVWCVVGRDRLNMARMRPKAARGGLWCFLRWD